MRQNLTAAAILGDLACAVSLLTRVPMRAPHHRGADAGWAWPVVGLGVGGAMAVAAGAASVAGATPVIAAGLALAAGVILTGAMHEDGLADAADGLWGGWERARRLEIMRDSRIGTYGVMALVLVTGLRWSALAVLLVTPATAAAGIVATASLSRGVMAALSAALPHARADGLSVATGRVSRAAAVVAAALSTAAALALLGIAGGVGAVIVAGITAAACAAISWRKIGGQTGDILGASGLLAETSALVVLAGLAAT